MITYVIREMECGWFYAACQQDNLPDHWQSEPYKTQSEVRAAYDHLDWHEPDEDAASDVVAVAEVTTR